MRRSPSSSQCSRASPVSNASKTSYVSSRRYGFRVSSVCSRSHGQPSGERSLFITVTSSTNASPRDMPQTIVGRATLCYTDRLLHRPDDSPHPKETDPLKNHTAAEAAAKDKLVFEDTSILQVLLGTSNANLKLIERESGAFLHVRGNEVTL